jgi:hypothetical protein
MWWWADVVGGCGGRMNRRVRWAWAIVCVVAGCIVRVYRCGMKISGCNGRVWRACVMGGCDGRVFNPNRMKWADVRV